MGHREQHCVEVPHQDPNGKTERRVQIPKLQIWRGRHQEGNSGAVSSLHRPARLFKICSAFFFFLSLF